MADDLNKLTVDELGKLFPIIIADYDPAWENLFLLEKKLILKITGPDLITRIEHIGSTAVPGLCAKPTVDILAEIRRISDCDQIIRELSRIGYQFIPKPENPPPHAMLAKGYSISGLTGQTYHLHLRIPGDWDELIFRDYLIANPDVAQRYAELKKSLAEEFRNDREKYTDGKGDFIRRITELARLLRRTSSQ